MFEHFCDGGMFGTKAQAGLRVDASAGENTAGRSE